MTCIMPGECSLSGSVHFAGVSAACRDPGPDHFAGKFYLPGKYQLPVSNASIAHPVVEMRCA